ncbi:MAG: hypothetical protein H6625_10145 [Bdellovibrionaceae bacterium]|nr:hypothetical protein [Pseudobdellovibrionaceae bacterium]
MKPITSLLTCELILFSMPFLLMGLGFFVPIIFPLALVSVIFIFLPGLLFYYILNKIEIYPKLDEAVSPVKFQVESTKVIYLRRLPQRDRATESPIELLEA